MGVVQSVCFCIFQEIGCTNGQDISYELSYTTDSGTLNTICVVNGAECGNSTCSHELQSDTADNRCEPPVSHFSGEGVTLSVTAENLVGRSNTAVSRSISEFSELERQHEKLTSC